VSQSAELAARGTDQRIESHQSRQSAARKTLHRGDSNTVNLQSS